MTEYAIETRQLTKTYGTFTALDHVSIHVRKGCIYGLVGDNGAGKSTLLRLLAGHSFATEGEIRLLGKFGEKALADVRRNIGCMVEQPGFFPEMTVEQTLKYYCIQKGVPDQKKVGEMLELTGISKKRGSKSGTLSLGQKQRLGLAIAMLGEPQALILDEPINGLDPSGMIEFRNLLHRLNEERNLTILLSSHILSELQQIADVYGFLKKGVLVEETGAADLQAKCPDCVEITLSDVEQYTAVFEKTFPAEDYKVLPENTIRIYTPHETLETYSKLASEHHIYITGMQAVKPALEDYYMQML